MSNRPPKQNKTAAIKNNGAKGQAVKNTGGKAKLRIIAGLWRSRQIPIPALEGLRPTPDRVRETLFNWINSNIAGANCADLFCGSGALGLEALSRDAKQCTFVDSSRIVAQQMRTNLATLNCENANIINQNAIEFLQTTPLTSRIPFDIIFIDPPFRKGWVDKILPLLEQGWLANKALVYIEMEKEAPLPELNSAWSLLKEKNAGQLVYRLFQINT